MWRVVGAHKSTGLLRRHVGVNGHGAQELLDVTGNIIILLADVWFIAQLF